MYEQWTNQKGPHKYGRAHEILILIASASSEGSDEPAHMRSLTRALASFEHAIAKYECRGSIISKFKPKMREHGRLKENMRTCYCVLLSCQPRVTVASCFVYKVLRDLESIDHLCINRWIGFKTLAIIRLLGWLNCKGISYIFPSRVTLRPRSHAHIYLRK